MAYALHNWAGLEPVHFVVLAAALCIPGVWSADVVARSMGKVDPGIVVVDEVIGQWVTLAGVRNDHWLSWVSAFVLFRALDIWKPPPARQLERLPGGYGIVADDVMAGIYAALLVYGAGVMGWWK